MLRPGLGGAGRDGERKRERKAEWERAGAGAGAAVPGRRRSGREPGQAPPEEAERAEEVRPGRSGRRPMGALAPAQCAAGGGARAVRNGNGRGGAAAARAARGNRPSPSGARPAGPGGKRLRTEGGAGPGRYTCGSRSWARPGGPQRCSRRFAAAARGLQPPGRVCLEDKEVEVLKALICFRCIGDVVDR